MAAQNVSFRLLVINFLPKNVVVLFRVLCLLSCFLEVTLHYNMAGKEYDEAKPSDRLETSGFRVENIHDYQAEQRKLSEVICCYFNGNHRTRKNLVYKWRKGQPLEDDPMWDTW